MSSPSSEISRVLADAVYNLPGIKGRIARGGTSDETRSYKIGTTKFVVLGVRELKLRFASGWVTFAIESGREATLVDKISESYAFASTR